MKVYKVTEQQFKVIQKHINESKKLVENFGPTAVEDTDETPESKAFYSQNPEAKIAKEKKEAEELQKQQLNGEVSLDEEDPKIAQQVTSVLQKLGIIPGQTNSAPVSKDSTAAIQATASMATPAGPTPAPTGSPDQSSLSENDPNIEAAVSGQLKSLGIDPQKLKQVSSTAPSNSPTATPQHSVQMRQTVNTPANPQPIGEEQPVSNAPAPVAEETDLIFKSPIKVSLSDTIHIDLADPELEPYESHELDANGELVVTWSLDIDARNYGIKSLDVNITGVQGSLFISHPDSGFEKEVMFTGEDFQIENEIVIGSTIYPQSIEINFARKTITIS